MKVRHQSSDAKSLFLCVFVSARGGCVCAQVEPTVIRLRSLQQVWVGWGSSRSLPLFLAWTLLVPFCSSSSSPYPLPSPFSVAFWCPIPCSVLGTSSFSLRPDRIASRRADSTTAHTCSTTFVRLDRVLGLDIECRRRCALLWPRRGLSIVPALLHLPNPVLRFSTPTTSFPTLDTTSMLR